MLVADYSGIAPRDAAVRDLVLTLQARLISLPSPVKTQSTNNGGVPKLPGAQDIRFNLAPFSDVLGHRSTTPGGIVGMPLRMFRALFHFVMGPWLDIQTLFNRAVIKTLIHEQLANRAYLEQLRKHLHETVDDDIRSQLQACRRDLNALFFAQGRSIRNCSSQAAYDQETGFSFAIIERIFVQAWMPQPPARLLAVTGSEDCSGFELAGMGYQVQAVDISALLQAELPYSDGAFDGVVCVARPDTADWQNHLPELLHSFKRVLRADGKVVLSVPLAEMKKTHQAVVDTFHLVEMALATNGARGLTYTNDAATIEALMARAEGNGLALVAAEKN